MKRILSASLALCLALSLCPISAGAASQNERLEAVTTLVKNQIPIDDHYTNFVGELQDDALTTEWNLRWSADGETLLITASEDGTIRQYNHYIPDEVNGYYGYAPALPKVTHDQAQQVAADFVKRVLRTNETVQLDVPDSVAPLNQDTCGLSGTLYYDGLPTPGEIYVAVRTADLTVSRFTRSGDIHTGSVPSKVPTVTDAQAQQKLKAAQQLRLQYTTETMDGTPSKQAVLRYVPVSENDVYVDAQNGELIDLSVLELELPKYGDTGGSAAGDSTPENGLNPTEQAGADLLRNVLDKNTLDAKLRAMTALNLSGFAAPTISYAVNSESGEVFARVNYYSETRYAAASVDAKTGQLQSFRSSSEVQSKPVVSDTTKQRAQEFLQKYNKEYSKTALLDTNDDSYCFAEQVNGYPFPENHLQLSLDKDGTVLYFAQSWTDDITFDGAEGVLPTERALDAYWGTFQTTLGYQAHPVALRTDDPRYADYQAHGYSCEYVWKLGYTAQSTNHCRGVDAKTGAPLYMVSRSNAAKSYSDITTQTHPQIAALAQYGIGLPYAVFEPEKSLTQSDLLALLLSADGYTFDPTSEGALDQLYARAYDAGLLTRAERAPDAFISRAALVKLVISGTGFGKTAELPGIYRTDFIDDADIPADDYGYVATAQGMGLVRGDELGRFQPNNTATREQAAIVLYNFMNR